MKKNTHTEEVGLDARTLGFATVAALLGIGFAMAVSTSAYADPETREAERAALENRDYEGWKALHEDMPRAATISEEDFDALVAMHEARMSGDYEKAAEIREDLDLSGRGGFGGERGMRRQARMIDSEHHEDVEAALQSGDYVAWKDLMQSAGRRGGPAQFVTEENFDTFRAMHEAIADGDTERAAELREELGLPTGPGAGHGRGHGMGGGRGFGMSGERF